jgi:hypothetical protein
VQNEPKLGETGACRQRLRCRLWLGWGVKRAKRTQFPDCGLWIADCGLKDVGRGRPTHEEAKRAKRTQFGPAGGGRRRPNAQNEPNFRGSAGGWNPHYSTIPSFHHSNPMPSVQNEPNLAPRSACRRVNVRNEAKLGDTGVYRKRSSCRPGPGRATNVQNEPNSSIADWGPRIAD